LSHDGETGRHHSDDAALTAVRLNRRVEHVATSAEACLPEFVREQDDCVVAFEIFIGSEEPPEGGLDTKGLQCRGRSREAGDFFGLPVEDHIEPRRPRHAEVLERAIALAPRHEVCRRDNVARPVARDVVFPDDDKAIGIRIGQRLENHAADNAENGGGGADAQCQREDRGDGEPRRAQERANGKPQILEKIALHVLFDGPKEPTVGSIC
jgi:hypothetical protein